jgi:hypothetical protein
VNVSEETQWRARALQAEGKIAELESGIGQLRGELESARETLTALQRRRAVEQELINAKAADVETAMLLVERALSKEPEREVAQIVAEVKSAKPHLFEIKAPARSMSMSALPRESAASAVDMAMEKARSSRGERRSLLSYLRAKRQGI